jgi:hypothetical protein
MRQKGAIRVRELPVFGRTSRVRHVSWDIALIENYLFLSAFQSDEFTQGELTSVCGSKFALGDPIELTT